MKNDLDPQLIGKVVVLQTSRRREDNSTELVDASMEKYVGTLLGYSVSPTLNAFTFQGMSQPILISKKKNYFELYMPNAVRESTVRDSAKSTIADVSTRVVDDVILATQSDADKVLAELRKFIGLYGSVSISDLHDLVGVPSQFTDSKWGWKSIHSATVFSDDRGFLLNLPRPIALNKD